MKFLICSLLVLAPLGGAEKPPAARSAEVKKANRAQAAGIPAGAVEKSPGNWYYTDAQGKGWVYSQTPFGISRREDKPPAQDARSARQQEAELGLIQAVEDGDVVRFERKSPFGVAKWSRPKAELNEMERKALESRRTKAEVSTKDKQE